MEGGGGRRVYYTDSGPKLRLLLGRGGGGERRAKTIRLKEGGKRRETSVETVREEQNKNQGKYYVKRAFFCSSRKARSFKILFSAYFGAEKKNQFEKSNRSTPKTSVFDYVNRLELSKLVSLTRRCRLNKKIGSTPSDPSKIVLG